MIEHLKCQTSWDAEGGITVYHKERGVLPVKIKNESLILPEEMCQELIDEVEEVIQKKMRIKKAEVKPKEEYQEDQGKKEDFSLSSVWPELKNLIRWLFKHDVKKGFKVLKMSICRNGRNTISLKKKSRNK